MFGNNTLDVARNGADYRYGIDKTGQTYIYNNSSKKMDYYGDAAGAANKIVRIKLAGDRAVSEGDQRVGADTTSPPSNTGRGGGGGYSAPAKVLDTAGIDSLDSLLATYDTIRSQAKQKAAINKNTNLAQKAQEKKDQETTYNGKKLTTLQDFGSAKTDTDINTRNTLDNLVSSLSTMGLGGSRELTRQVLDAANMSNRKANATQAVNNQSLDTAFNQYSAGNENDVKKINDKYGFDTGEADKNYGQSRQNALYKKADLYGAAGDMASKNAVMGEGDTLNSLISNSAFMNPSYDGTVKAMATPDLSNYTQDIAKYDTTAVGAPGDVAPGGLMPAGAPAGAGNLAVRAVAINNKDLGVKKKQAGDLGYGV